MLKVWCPLTKDKKNYGMSRIEPSGGGTITGGGKLGNCLSFNGSDDSLNLKFDHSRESYSSLTFCCWVSFNTLNGTHLMDARLHDNSGYQPMYLTRASIQSGSVRGGFPTYPYSFNLNQWYHIAVTYSAESNKVYVDGALIGATSGNFMEDVGINRTLKVGSRYTGENKLNGKVNDIRIYYEELSAKEIKELSKGLVLHYNFETSDLHPLTNIIDPSQFSLNSVTENGGVYTFNGSFAMINQSLPTPTAGHKYYGRVWQKAAPGATYADGRFEYYYTDLAGTGLLAFAQAATTNWADNKWHMTSDIQALTGLASQTGWILRSFTVNGSYNLQRKEMMVIDLTASFGAGNEPNKAWCDAFIPYFTGTIYLGADRITDVSGNGHHGSLANPAYYQSIGNSMRGSKSLHSLGHPTAAIVSTLPASIIKDGTLIVWYRKDISAMNYNGGNFLMATQHGGGTWLCATNGDAAPFNSAAAYVHWYVDGVEQAKSNYTDTSWHMYAATGVDISSWNGLAFQQHGDDSWLYRGEIAEIRLYNTQLSAKDIMDLFNAPESVDKRGNVYAIRMVEK